MMDNISDMWKRKDDRFIPILAAFALGGLLGASLAMLMAPKSGDETRSMIREKSAELKDRTVGAVEDTRSKMGSAIGDLASTTKDRVSSLTSRGKDMIQHESEELRSKVHDAKDSLSY